MGHDGFDGRAAGPRTGLALDARPHADTPSPAAGPAPATPEIGPLLPDYANKALDVLRAAGKQRFVVGGFVRDALMGSGAHDVDVATDALWYQTTDIFERAGFKVVATGAKHGTVTVVVDGRPVEVTTFRTDGSYSDHRRPDRVRFVNDVLADLARRDLTVNAMAWSPETGLIDPYGGHADIDARVVRAVGDPDERFEEDALRVMRAVRFASRLGFSVDGRTADAVHAHVDDIDHVAIERVAHEYDLIVRGAGAVAALRSFPDVAAKAVPPIGRMVGFEQRSRWHVFDVWEHCLHALAQLDPAAPAIVRHATLLHDVGKPWSYSVGDDGYGHFYGHEEQGARILRKTLSALRWRSCDVAVATTLVRYHDHHIDDSPRGVRRMLTRIARTLGDLDSLTCDVFEYLLMLKRADALAHAPSSVLRRLRELDAVDAAYRGLHEGDQAFRVRDLAVTGDDVIAFGVAQGPAVGAVLRRLLSAVVEGDLPNEREALLDALKREASVYV